MAYNVEFKRGNSLAYKSLINKDDKVFYYTEDDKQLYLGDVCLTSVIDESLSAAVTELQQNMASLGADVANIMGDESNISSIAYAVAQGVAGISSNIGVLDFLTTDQKATLVDAINEVEEEVGALTTLLGTIPSGYSDVVTYLQNYVLENIGFLGADVEAAKSAADTATKEASDAKAASEQALAAAQNSLKGIAAKDNSIEVDETGAIPTIAVKIAPNSGLELRNNGLAVSTDARQDTIDYSIQVNYDNNGNYTIKQEATGVETTISIPKDMVVESGNVEVLTEEKDGQAPGTYLVLTLANALGSKVYIPVDSLVEYVTSGSTNESQIKIDISENHEITATLASNIRKDQLASIVQESLNKANTALQSGDIGTAAKADVEDFDAAGSASAAYTNAQTYIDNALTWGTIGE